MARAGRKRKFAVPRHPGGRIRQEDARQTVTNQRMRLHGIAPQDARSDLAGYAVGRMALKGMLGTDWREIVDASNAYVRATARYMRIKFPSWPLPRAMDWISARGASLDTEIEEIDKVVERYERYRAVLATVDGISRMKFHSAAFDDVGEDEIHAKAVHKCASAILVSLVKPRKP